MKRKIVASIILMMMLMQVMGSTLTTSIAVVKESINLLENEKNIDKTSNAENNETQNNSNSKENSNNSVTSQKESQYVTEDDLVYSEKYLVKDNIISKIDSNTTKEEFIKNLEIAKNEKVEIYKKDSQTKVEAKELIGTGMTLKGSTGEEYTLSVRGDITGDGKADQIELTMMIRHLIELKGWELKDINKLSADITGDDKIDLVDIDKMINYIVFGKWEKENVEVPNPPTIKIVGEKVEGEETDTYKNKAEITIKAENKEKSSKTTYKITGQIEKEETSIEENEKIVLTEEGEYIVTAYTYGLQGNRSKASNVKIVIKKEEQEEPTDPEKIHNIEYVLNGGENSKENQNTYEEGKETTLKEATRLGYTFVGWYTEESFTNKIERIEKSQTGDITLYAKWTPNTDTKYKVVHEQMNLDGETYTIVETEELEGTTEAKVTPEVKQYVGFKSPEPQEVIIEPDGSTIVIYRYERNKYEFTLGEAEGITINGLEGIESTLSGTYYYEEEIRLNAKTEEGYTWEKWISSNEELIPSINEANATFKMPAGSLIMTPKATINTYTINYELNGGINSEENPNRYTYGQEVVLKEPTKVGYTFEGWYTEEDFTNKIEKIESTKKENITLYANWTANTNTKYKVVHEQLNIDGETYTIVETENFTGTSDAKVTPEVKQYVGFKSPETQEVTIEADGSTIVTYKYERNKYAFVLGDNETIDTSEGSKSGQYYYEEEIVLKAKANKGYTFTGWISSKSNVIKSFKEAEATFIMPLEDIAMIPTSTLNIYTINYNLNGGQVEGTNPTTYNVTSENITLNNPTKEGYTFTGWTLENDEVPEENNIDPIENVIIETGSVGNRVYTANWEINTYKISYNLNNGQVENENPETYTIETESFTLNNPTRVGYTFVGWTEETTENKETKNSEPQLIVTIQKGSKGDKSFAANWEANTNTKYKVVHEQMNLDGETYTIIETEELEGTSDAKVTPEVKEYAGFTSPKAMEIIIAPDGSTIVTYKYERNKYEFILGENVGVTIEGSTPSGSYYYGKTIELNAIANKGYTWAGWTSSNGSLVPSTSETNKTFTMPAGNLSMTPTCTLNVYTINYNLNNGQVENENPTTYSVISEDIILNNPIREGYTFVGWTEETAENNETTNKVPQMVVTIPKGSIGDKEYTANWTANPDTRYQVVHEQMNLDGITYTAVETEELEGTSNEKVTPEVKTYTGFTSPEAQEITIEPDGSTIVIYRYERNKYEFTLGEAEGIDTQGSSISENYYYGETIELNSLIKSGYTWTGWTSSNEELIPSTNETNVTFTMPAGDLSMTPTCTLNVYTINYNLNGGEAENPETYSVTTETITLNNPIREGYTFVGWTEETIENNETTTSEPQLIVTIPKGSIGNKEYTANWEANANTKYKVVHEQLNTDGETYTIVETEELEGISDSKVTPQVKQYIGFTSPEAEEVIIESDGSTIVTYKYERNKYTFVLGVRPTVDASEGSQSGEYYYEEEIVLKAKAKLGYTFVEWISSDENIVKGFSEAEATFKMPLEEISMIPITTLNKYTISYNLNGGEIAEENETKYDVTSKEITLSNPSKVGYTFIGWTLENDERPEENTETPELNVIIETGSVGNRVYTANYTPIIYTINYNLNNGQVEGNPTTYTIETENFTLNNPAREGYTFIGWTGSNGDVPEINVSIPKGTIGNKEYTANWEDQTYPTITSNLNITNITTCSITASIEAQDKGTGLDKVIWYYKKSSEENWTEFTTDTYTTGTTEEINKTNTFTGLEDNTNYDIRAVVYDVAENTTTIEVTNQKTDELTIRLTADPAKEYTKGDVYVTIEANGSETKYGTEVDAMNTAYTSPVQVTTNGTTIHAYTTDGTNTERASKTINNIDKEGPSEVTITYNGGDNTCSWKNDYDLTFSATDTQSGVAYYEYEENGDEIVEGTIGANWIPPNGYNRHVRFRAVDKLGNVGPWSDVQHIHMDTEPPSEVTITYNGGDNTCSWKNDYDLTFSATDAQFEVTYYELDTDWDETTIEYTINSSWIPDRFNTNWIPDNWLNTCSLRVRAVDNAGNKGPWTEPQHIHMDTEAPNEFTISENSKTINSVTINAETTDKENGVAFYRYYYDGDTYVEAGANATIEGLTAGRTYSIYVVAYDHAENPRQSSNTIEVTISSNKVFAIVYSDGTLAFNTTGRTDSNKGVLMAATDITDSHYSSTSTQHWSAYKERITKVVFEERVSPKQTACWFEGLTNLTLIENIQNLDTSKVTDMYRMFAEAKVTDIDFSNFDFTNVTTMELMFASAHVTNVNFSNLNLSKVTNMYEMFVSSYVTNVDFSNSNLSNVTTMEMMFPGTNNLTSVNFSNADLSNVTNMYTMFATSAVRSINFENTKVLKVENMNSMFAATRNLENINLTSFNLNNIENMHCMFSSCEKITKIELPVVNSSKLTDMSSMFSGCSSLININMSNWNVPNLTDSGFRDAFSGAGIESFNMSNFRADNLTTLSGSDGFAIWGSCPKLKTINLSNMYLPNVIIFGRVFNKYPELQTINFSNMYLPNVISIDGCFMDNKFVQTIDLSNIYIPKVTDINGMFANCSNLRSVDLTNVDTSNITRMGGMFYQCPSLQNVYVTSGKWATSQADTDSMFSGAGVSSVTYR